MMLHKQKVIETIESLKSEFTIDELCEKISFIEHVEEGLEDIKNGQTISEKELEKKIEEWRK